MFDSFLVGNKSKAGVPILMVGMLFGKDFGKKLSIYGGTLELPKNRASPSNPPQHKTGITTLQPQTCTCVLHYLTKTSRKNCNTAAWCRAKTDRTCTARAAGLQQHLSSDQCIPLYQSGSVLTTTLFLHFFLGGGVAELKANISQCKQIIPNSFYGEKESPPGPQGLRILTHSLMFTLTYILNYLLLSWIFPPPLKICFQLLQ